LIYLYSANLIGYKVYFITIEIIIFINIIMSMKFTNNADFIEAAANFNVIPGII
jgi:hypothetical protein